MMPKPPQQPGIGQTPETAVEITPLNPVTVRETHQLYRLSPVGEDLAQPHRQIALIAAENEYDARTLAAVHDPFGRLWMDDREFACDTVQTQESHVVGDVVFKSVPAPPIVKAKRN